jgi:uncharacterized membrane protein YhaH (DUF805 family)
MLEKLFADVARGRLARLPYLGCLAVLGVSFVLAGLALGAGIGVAERLIGGDVAAAQKELQARLGGPFAIVIGLCLAVMLFAHANIAAKRLRDIGLPGWLALLAIVVLSVLLSGLVGAQAGTLWGSAVTLVLLLVPSGAVGASKT